MSRNFSGHTTTTKHEVFLTWKIDDFSNAHCGPGSSIVGPVFVMPTQPASNWQTFVDYRQRREEFGYFRAQPLHFYCATTFKINYTINYGTEESKLNFSFSNHVYYKNSKTCIRRDFLSYERIYANGIYETLSGKDLFFKCQFTVLTTSLTSTATVEKVPSENDVNCLSDNFKTLYSSKTFSDFTIVAEGKSFPVHRCILSSRSPVFAAMLKGDTAEASNDELVIKDFKTETMEAFLLFIYTGRLGELSTDEYCQLYSASDKYAVESLKKITAQKLTGSISVDNVCDVYTLGHFHSDDILKSAANTYVKQNASSVLISENWINLVSQNNGIATQLIKETGIH